MSNDSVSDRTKHIDVRSRWISSFVPHRIYVGHVPTDKNCSDIFTKNTTAETFIKHAHDINNGTIKCFINHLGPTYTREDVEKDESWTVVTKKKQVSKPKKLTWCESVKKNMKNDRTDERSSRTSVQGRFLSAKNQR